MPVIRRQIQVSYVHQVHFTHGVFQLTNRLLCEVLLNGEAHRPQRALVVVDETLALARPGLARDVEAYFSGYAKELQLVCPVIVMEGGERVKNSYFHVSEVQSQVERYHLD